MGWQVGSDLRDALQKNPLADLRFATIFNKDRVLIVPANIPGMFVQLYRVAFKQAMDLNRLVMATKNGKRVTLYQHLFGSNEISI